MRPTAPGDLVLGDAAEAQRETHVPLDAHMRIERVVLEDHRDVAILRRVEIDDPVADADLAVGNVLEAGDHAQQGRFAAAGRSDQGDEFAVLDVDIDAVQDFGVPVGFAQIPDDDTGHADASPAALLRSVRIVDGPRDPPPRIGY